MTTKVTITFEVPEDKYDEYEECLSDFDSNLQYIGITDMDVREDDNNDNDGVRISKDVLCEIDGELFFNEISMDTKSWSFDYEDLEENTKVFEYVKEYYPNELQALKDGKTDQKWRKYAQIRSIFAYFSDYTPRESKILGKSPKIGRLSLHHILM